MTEINSEKSQQFYARLSGFLYLFIIVESTLIWIMVYSKLMVAGDDAATAANIVADEWMFRFGSLFDLVMFASVAMLSWTLYLVLKPVNNNIALLALVWRIVEAAAGCVVVFVGLAALEFLSGENSLAGFLPEQLNALLGSFLRLKATGVHIALVFYGLGSVIFCYLFLVSRYVPKLLAIWGIGVSFLMLLISCVGVLFPSYSEMIEIAYAPGALFELVFGLWLLVKGVEVGKGSAQAVASV